MSVDINKQGIISASGGPNPNLFRATSMTKEERAVSDFVTNGSTDWTKYFRFYNGTINNHTFIDDIDTVLLNSASNLGIAFQRKATDIDLDSTSYYTISCEAKCTKLTHLDIGLSYYNTSNSWVWRGGSNPQNFNAINTWQKFILSFKPDANTQYIMYCFTVVGASSGTDTFSIRHCKLEKSSTATEWMPNENDVDFLNNHCGFIENKYINNNCKIQKNGYIQANEFIEI